MLCDKYQMDLCDKCKLNLPIDKYVLNFEVVASYGIKVMCTSIPAKIIFFVWVVPVGEWLGIPFPYD